VRGIGAAASALAISAARAVGDAALAERLEASAALAQQALRTVASGTLAEAIRYQARWQPVLARAE
jgi:type II secretory pathway pseudopilin PulG